MINWKKIDEMPSPYKEKYGDSLKEIEGLAIIDNELYTDNLDIMIKLDDFNTMMSKRYEGFYILDSVQPKYMASLIVENNQILKCRW